MKKIFAMLLCAVLLTGCNAPRQPLEETAQPAKGTTETLESTQATTEAATLPAEAGYAMTLYVPNGDATGFQQLPGQVPELTVSHIFAALHEAGVLNSDAAANSLELDGTALLLDVNDGFRTQLSSYGTSGEYYMLGSVVNTLLTAYQAQTVQITCNGAIMETGHVLYDYPLEFYPDL